MDPEFHFPPDLFALLEDAIALLFKGKEGIVLFFRGAGVSAYLLDDVARRVATDRDSVRKLEIARTVLTRLNEGGDATLRARREVLKRITEVEDFASAWPEDRERVENLVGRIRHVVNAKDALTRIELERQAEARRRRQDVEARLVAQQAKAAEREHLRRDLSALFGEGDSQKRGKMLEPVLNALFALAGCRVRQAFEVRQMGVGVVEQIDGLVDLDGNTYLVEAKWYRDRVGPGEIAPALVRTYGRAEARGIIISASGFTDAAVATTRDALAKAVVVLCELHEIVLLLEGDGDPADWLRSKVTAAIADKNPLFRPSSHRARFDR